MDQGRGPGLGVSGIHPCSHTTIHVCYIEGSRTKTGGLVWGMCGHIPAERQLKFLLFVRLLQRLSKMVSNSQTNNN